MKAIVGICCSAFLVDRRDSNLCSFLWCEYRHEEFLVCFVFPGQESGLGTGIFMKEE